MLDDDDDRPVLRDMAGRFQPGTRALSTGRPPMDGELREALQAAAPKAVAKLVELSGHDDPRIALTASEAILSRLFGKPAQQINADIRTADMGAMHLKVLEEIRERRAARLALEASAKG